MTNEQREAIEICKEKIIESFYDFPNPTSIELKDTDVEVIEIVLSLIKEQQEEIEKKDKQIDLMVEMIDELSEYHPSNNEFCKEICIEKDIDCRDCIKQYFAELEEKGQANTRSRKKFKEE